MTPKRYPIKKGLRILTRKRGSVSNYLTLDDVGGIDLINKLLETGQISEPAGTPAQPATKFPDKPKKSTLKD